ncbi:MAG: quinoprotein dehydrogenase-associated SoxYZ-like carrier [Gammaproteobacteria bacterium]
MPAVLTIAWLFVRASFAAMPIALSAAQATDSQVDPLGSPQWEFMHRTILDGAPYAFDSRVVVMTPASAEDAMNVPVSFRVEGLGTVERVVVFADLNPIHKVLVFHPHAARAALGFRVKIEQATPIRAAALTADGVWHVGGAWVDAAGGGCTAPGYSRTAGTWYETLGQVRHHRWPGAGGVDAVERLRLQVMHPMDTGLAEGIPAFYLERLEVTDDEGRRYATLELFEPVSENPYFTLDLDAGGRPLRLSGHDLNGNRVEAELD